MATEVAGMLASPEPAARDKMLTLLIARQHEIARAGVEALLQARGHRVIGRCVHEDDLLRFVEAYRSDKIILAENIVRREAAVQPKTIFAPATSYPLRNRWAAD